MKIKAVDFFTKKQLYADISPLKKNIQIISEEKNSKVFSFIPTIYQTFRYFEFPFTDKAKIKKAVQAQLLMEFKDLSDYSYTYYQRKNKIFCIITRKSLIEQIKNEEKSSSIDSDIFCIIRLLKFSNIKTAKVLHFCESLDYAFLLEVENLYPVKVQTIQLQDAKNFVKEDILISGELPQELKNHKNVLNNPTKDPSLNILYGLLLKPVYEEGVDFLHLTGYEEATKFLKIAIYVILGLIFINGGIFVQKISIEKQIKQIKSKEKEIFMKAFNKSTVIDPISQAKGIIANQSENNKETSDVADILLKITKSRLPQISFIQLKVSHENIFIKGKASSINKVENFRQKLLKYFPQVKIEESIKDASGQIRFSIKVVLNG